jgi:hypothetical protein
MPREDIKKLLEDIVKDFGKQRAEEMVQPANGYKEDTLQLDVFFEQRLIKGLLDIEPNAVIISEESGRTPKGRKLSNNTPVYFIDPVDMSEQLKEKLQGKTGFVQDILGEYRKAEFDDYLKQNIHTIFVTSCFNEFDSDVPATFVTRVLNGRTETTGINIVYLGGYSSKSLVGACWIKGPYKYLWPDKHYIFTCTHGGSRQLNLRNLGFIPVAVHHAEEGPHRFVHLRSISPKTVCIMSNGEKITEWIHWLSCNDRDIFSLYDISYPNSPQKDGFCYAPDFSLSPLISDGKSFSVDVEKLDFLENPALYRATLFITSSKYDYYRILKKPPVDGARIREILQVPYQKETDDGLVGMWITGTRGNIGCSEDKRVHYENKRDNGTYWNVGPYRMDLSATLEHDGNLLHVEESYFVGDKINPPQEIVHQSYDKKGIMLEQRAERIIHPIT